MESKLHVNVCLTGCVHSKFDNPNLPTTPDEIVTDIKKCYALGARAFHIHARNMLGEPVWQKEYYQKIIDKIPYDDILICVSTSGRHWSDIDKRSDCLDCTGIHMASLTLGSLNFFNSTSINHPETIRELAKRMNERGIKPELEVFETGHLNFAHRLIKEEILHPPYYFNLIFGSPWSMPYSLDLYNWFVDNMPDDSHWNVAGIGRYQQAALSLHHNIRVGLEDNLYLNGELTTNEQLVSHFR